MNLFGNIKIPFYLLFIVFAGIASGFTLWRHRNKAKIKSSIAFDYILLSAVVVVVMGKILYLIQNLTQYVHISWSFVPYYFVPGAQRVWFKQMPWVLFKFWDGNLSYSGMVFVFIVFSMFFIKYHTKVKNYYKVLLKTVSVGLIVMFLGYFIGNSYIGKETTSFIGLRYFDEKYRVAIPLVETGFVLVLLVINKVLGKRFKGKTLFGIFLFLFGWLEIFLLYLRDDDFSSGSKIVIQMLYLLFVFLGIFTVSFSLQSGRIIEMNDVKQQTINETDSKRKKVKFSYRDFSSSFNKYNTSRPSIFGWIKRKIQGFRQKNDRV